MNKNIINTKRDYTEYCPNGFILCNEPIDLNWENFQFFKFNFYFSKSTKYSLSVDKKILVIGNIYDIEDQISNEEVIENIENHLNKSLAECIKYITYLAGRFLVFIESEGKLLILPDSHCTMACYWSESEKNVFTSHLQLLKDHLDFEKNEVLSEIMNHIDYISPGGKYFPAKLTPLKNVYPLIANCLLKYDPQGKTIHERYYPHMPLQKKYHGLSQDDIYLRFKQYLINYLKLTYKKNNTYISLTNGLDSRAVLSALILAGIELESFTYARFGENSQTFERDLLGAARLSATAGIPHFILSLPKLDYKNTFYKLYSKTFSLHARFPSLTQAYYEQLPIGANVLVSTISETGTIFYQVRDEKEISEIELSKKWSYSKINNHEIIHEEFNKYIEYTNFKKESIFDYNFYDLFYWEHRNSKWGNLWYQECDLSHNVILPFNCRLINELMLILPFEKRKSKYLLNRLIEDSGLNSSPDAYA